MAQQLDALAAQEIADDRVREVQTELWAALQKLGACVARLGGKVVLEADELNRHSLLMVGLELSTRAIAFPLVKNATGSHEALDRLHYAADDRGRPYEHDEPAADWPPVVPGEFPQSH